MKKQLLLIGLIFGMFVAFAQTTETKNESQPTATADSIAEPQNDFCPHRILFRIGGGYANYTFKKLNNVSVNCSYTALAELGYTYFFHQNIGIGIGIGINHTGIFSKINESSIIYDYYDRVYDPKDPTYDLEYTAAPLKQQKLVWAIDIPLTLQFEKKWGKHGIYAGVGIKGYFPFSAKIGYTDGTIKIDKIIDKEGLNVVYTDLLIHMDDRSVKGQSAKPKLRCSVDVIGEFGGVFGIARDADFYLGIFASYGFLNVYPKKDIYPKADVVTTENANPKFDVSQVVSKYVSSTNKWHLFQAGVKFGFHFLPCKSCANDEYMRDQKRRFMDKMMEKKDEPIIVTNTVEYYYFLPTISQELLDESENNPDKKKAILELAQSLSNIKILFDLDKDIPKMDDNKNEHIRRAVELLKANPDLKVMITGYTSPEGTVEHNKDLGYRRAIAVRKFFIDQGVPVDQISTQNFTAEDPQHKADIPEKDYKEQRAVIFRIEKK
ncbi:MAG: OmpA family protein [Bacteroidales bacterium]|jgi:outer membrane protein OmpA-like peptidoglycan-associated protein|nr:OmpA family protein [Bacteroidales bacterium]